MEMYPVLNKAPRQGAVYLIRLANKLKDTYSERP